MTRDRAALLGVVGHELRTLFPDAVDVGRLADHQSLVVDARLHPADVVAHDEQDIGLFPFVRTGGFGGHDQFLADLDLVRRQLVLRLQRAHGNLEALADHDQFVALDHRVSGGDGVVLAPCVVACALVSGLGSAGSQTGRQVRTEQAVLSPVAKGDFKNDGFFNDIA